MIIIYKCKIIYIYKRKKLIHKRKNYTKDKSKSNKNIRGMTVGICFTNCLYYVKYFVKVRILI